MNPLTFQGEGIIEFMYLFIYLLVQMSYQTKDQRVYKNGNQSFKSFTNLRKYEYKKTLIK